MTNKPVEAFHLLDQLQRILDRDPLIDELGFIHPSQLMMLNEGEDAAIRISKDNKGDAKVGSEPLDVSEVEGKNDFFWSKEHKLGISTEHLLPLFKAARHRFMDAYANYKENYSCYLKNESAASSCVLLEIEDAVMKHSKALLLLSSDFGTAWNARKLILSRREEFSVSDELLVSSLVLSLAPKSESAWNYRRWVIKKIAGGCRTVELILAKESELVEKIAEKSKMNYRAWNHRCWLISYMDSEQALCELNTNRKWAALNVADNSCFHYRRKLMLRMLGDVSHGIAADTCITQELLKQLWKDELDWNEMLIRRYIGREALWLHRRFLSVYWVKHFVTDQLDISQHPNQKSSEDDYNTSIFIHNEVSLLQDCLNLPESMFEDVQSQIIYSAFYILWLNKQLLCPSIVNLNQKLEAGDLRTLLNKMCPEKITAWDCLLGEHSLSDSTHL